MFARQSSKLLLLSLCVILGGCATSRSEIKLQSPVASAATSAAVNGRVVVIRSISDDRVFEQAPSDPSTPSLGFGGSDRATAAVKARAIGRKRNGFGKALGDVLLENGQTVEDVVRTNLTVALQQAGYQVKTEAGLSANPLVLDVRIKQFWAWFRPGFWAITLSSNIATELYVTGVSAPLEITTHTEENRQMATEGAWMEIVQKGLTDYRAQVAAKMNGRF
ncbi:MAG TPA: hypothetical protein VGC19_16140 [Rhodanobacter sp.]